MKRLPIVLAALSVVASCVSPPSTNHMAELEYLKEFYTRRLGWLNVELNRL